MSKRKFPPTQVDELFELKTKLVLESVKKTIKLHDFIKKIEDQEKKIKAIVSPKFKVAEIEFSIIVYPEYDGFIGVFLRNYSKEVPSPMSSFTVKAASGVEMSREIDDWYVGFGTFLSHEKYREWVKTHGDVLELEVLVTVNSKAEGDGWSR